MGGVVSFEGGRGVEGVMALRGILYRANVGGIEGFSSTWKGVD